MHHEAFYNRVLTSQLYVRELSALHGKAAQIGPRYVCLLRQIALAI